MQWALVKLYLLFKGTYIKLINLYNMTIHLLIIIKNNKHDKYTMHITYSLVYNNCFEYRN